MRLKHFLSVFLTLLTLSVGQMWGAENDPHDFAQDISQGLNDCATFDDIEIAEQSYTIKSVIVTYAYNKSNSPSATLTIGSTEVGTETFTGTGNLTTTSTITFTPTSAIKGAVTIVHNSGSSCTGSKKGTLKITNVRLVEGASAAPSYTITAQSNNTNYGTVSKSGSVITGSPKSGYRYASPAYSVSPANSATVSQEGDEFTVTPSANTTITINFEAIPTHTLNYHDGDGDDTKTGVLEGTNLIAALGTPAESCDETSTTFMGWSTTKISTKTSTSPTFVAADAVVNATTAAPIYYAVYAKGGSTFKLSYTYNSITYYVGKKGTGTYLDAESSLANAAEFGFESATGGYYVYYIDGSDKIYIGGTGSNTTLNTATNTPGETNYVWTYTENNGILEIHIGSRYLGLNTSTKDRFSTYTSGYSLTKHAGSVSDYITNCCTKLGQINGSVSWNNGEATVSFADLADVTGWGLKYKKTSDSDVPASWSTYSGNFSPANSTRSNSTAISGLDAGVSYDFKVTGTYNGSSYCTGAFEVPLYPSSSSYVPQMGNPSAASITGLGYIYGAATSAAQSFTISASHLTGNLTVSAPNANFEVSTTSATTGFGSSATLTPTSGSLTNASVWVRLATGLEENTYGGNSIYVTITGGGAAGKQVSVTGVVGPACHQPSISGSLSNATYRLNVPANALTISATKGDESDPDLSYQWMQCATSDGTYVNAVGGSGATTNSYTPPTTTAGSDLYYKCKVSSGNCSDYSSSIAHITVNTPIITIGGNKTSHDFESKAIGSENELTISVSGTTLAKDQNISLAIEGPGASAYALSTNSLTASSGTVDATDVTITYTAAAGLSEATLTISSEGATSKTITLSGTGKYQATFIANGNSESILVDGEGKLVLPASNPSSCNGTYSTFIGWYSTAAGSNGDPTTNIASCETKAVTTHVLESNETYYAVWGNGSLVADDVKQVTIDLTDNSEWSFPEGNSNKTVAEQSFSDGTYTIKVAGSANQGYYYNATDKYLLFGKDGAYIELPAFSFTTSKIVVVGKGGASGSVQENIFVGDDAVSTVQTGATGTNTFAIASANQAAGNVYTLKVGNGYNAQVTKIEVYSPGSGVATGFISSCCSTWDAPTVSYSVPSDWKVGDAAVNVSVSGTTHGTASYESSDPSVISVAADGTITAVSVGSATITVTWSGDGYCEKAVTTAPIVVHGFVDVTFNGNGAEGSMTAQPVEVGVSTALNTNTFTAPACKEFGGWATSSDGEAVYTDGGNITASNATTLWAVWNTKTLSVAQGTGTAVGCEGGAFTYASSVACGGNVTITSSPDATHKAPFSITVLPIDAYEEIDGNVIKNVTKPITSISVSYTAKTSYAITWKVNDAPYAPHQEEEDGKVNGDALVYEGNTIATLPTAPADNTLGCANKFMGWSKHDHKSVKKAASDYSDLFTTASGAPAINEATTFYAVFATSAGESSWAELINETFDNERTSDYGTAITGSSFANFSGETERAFEGAYGTLKFGSSKGTGYITSKTLDLSKDFKVSLKAKAYYGTSLDAATLYVTVGSETQSVSTSSTDPLTDEFKTFVFEFDATEETVIEIGTSANRAYIDDVVISKKAATISDYVTECAAVEAPTFTPAAGTYNEVQSVELSSTTVGADIFYTTDNTTPSNASTAYSGAIAVNQNMTIKAIAIKGSDESDVAEAAYVLKVATPEISGATSFVTPATVTITATGADAIYYTTNGNDPTTESTPYTAPFTVDATTTIKAIAVKANWTSSEVASQAFTKITPMTVAAALTNIDALDNNGTIADQYVKGLISEISSYNNGTITYYISDDGTTTSQLQVYKGSAGVANGGNAFTSADDLKVGEEVVVFGTLKKYKSGSNPVIPEFVNPNEIVAYRPYSPMAWSANAYTAELGGSSNVFPSLSGTAGLTISYSSSDPTKASFADASVYDITLNALTGETPVTITATSAANEQYVATSVSYNLTVEAAVVRYSLSYVKNGGTSDATDSEGETETNLPNPLPTITKAGYNFGGWYLESTFENKATAGAALTENTTLYAQWLDPYTVAEALTKIAALEDNGTTGDVYVAGVVTDDEIEISSSSATYYIKDAGEDNSLMVYKGKGLNNADVSEGDIQEDDQVVVYGPLKKYVKNTTTTPEIVNPNHLYSRVRPTHNVTGVTVASTANVRAGKTVTLTAEIAPANATNKNVTWSVTSGDDYADVDENGVVTGKAEGTATIQVETEDGNFTATCTVTVAAGLPTFSEDDHEWIKVSNASKLVAGRFYVIAYEDANHTMTKTIDSYAAVASTTIENSVIASGTLGTNTAIFELGGTSSAWTLTEVFEEKMLGGSASPSLNWTSNQTWTIAFDENNDASIENVNSDCGVLCYNKSASPRRFKTYNNASSTCPLPQLYMWAELSHAVTFDANGGVAESVPDVERTDEGKIIIPATTPTHSDISKAFGGWYKSDAPATLYNAGDEFETNVDVTLYAKWNNVPTYTVTYVPGGTGTVPAVASYREGQEVQVEEASLSNPGYSFAGWTVKDAEQNVLPLDEENKFDMPASNVTITAVWSRISSQKWNLVEQGDELVIDAEYVIAYNSNTVQKALGAISSNIGTAINVTIDGDYLKGSEAMTAFTLVAGNNGENYAFQNGSKYLTWSSGNSLSETTTLDNASSWTIEIGENNKVDIKNVGTTTRYLQYNTGSPRFACYTNTQQKVLLFKKVANLIVEDEQTKTAAQVDASDITVKENGKLTINVDADEKEIGDITVEDGGELIITGSKHIKANNVYLSSTMASGKSSQMSGALAQLDIQGDVYFDITLGDGGNANKWHAFTVPFPVDAINGVFDLNNTKLNNEEHYAIMEYLGDVRAQGKYGWKKIRTTLVPGTFYLMTVDGLRTTYRFKKTADGALVAGNSKEIFEYAKSGDGQATDAGWNGVGNPTLMYGKVNAEVQVLDPENYVYVKKDPNSTNFVVGTPFFYQADAAGSISMLTADADANYAPARVAANGIEKIKVSFGNEEYTDYLDISASEEAKNEYQIGKDLAKMTMTSTPKVAQIFGKAYNSKLCMVYAPMANDQAVYDLTLYAPANGEYTIAAPNVENADLYLTYEGNIIWNLSMSAYPMELKKGNTEGYGLLLNAKAPMSPTGIENTDALNGANSVQKIILDEKVFILRGGKMYDVTGKAVK